MRINPSIALTVNFFTLMVVSNGLFLVGSDLAVLCGVILFGFSVVVFSIKLAVQMVIAQLKLATIAPTSVFQRGHETRSMHLGATSNKKRRNMRCPCGSQKKFKKCCLYKLEANEL